MLFLMNVCKNFKALSYKLHFTLAVLPNLILTHVRFIWLLIKRPLRVCFWNKFDIELSNNLLFVVKISFRSQKKSEINAKYLFLILRSEKSSEIRLFCFIIFWENVFGRISNNGHLNFHIAIPLEVGHKLNVCKT